MDLGKDKSLTPSVKLMSYVIKFGERLKAIEDLRLDARLQEIEMDKKADERLSKFKQDQEDEERKFIKALREEHSNLKAQIRMLRWFIGVLGAFFGLLWGLADKVIPDAKTQLMQEQKLKTQRLDKEIMELKNTIKELRKLKNRP